MINVSLNGMGVHAVFPMRGAIVGILTVLKNKLVIRANR